MTNHTSIDVAYAWAQIGLEPGASLDNVRDALDYARAYRFTTRKRVGHIRRFVEFFEARGQFGAPDVPFNEIRKAWHKKVKALHPDQNKSDPKTDELLKAVNGAYEIVDKIHREAKEYFRKTEQERQQIESDARHAAAREAQAAGRKAPRDTSAAEEALRRTRDAAAEPFTDAWGRAAVKYMAASVPRYIRHSRLSYLPRQAIIGSRFVMNNGKNSLVYDIIMLPEREFRRARLNLGLEGQGSPELSMSRLTPAYIPMDTRMVVVPETEADPNAFARAYFLEKFGLQPASATG